MNTQSDEFGRIWSRRGNPFNPAPVLPLSYINILSINIPKQAANHNFAFRKKQLANRRGMKFLTLGSH
jgi:hypothetical protein